MTTRRAVERGYEFRPVLRGLPPCLLRATSHPVSTPAIQGAEAAQGAARDWQAVRDSAAIQFQPTPPPPEVPPAPPPDWLKALGEALGNILGPIGNALGLSVPVLQWVVLGIAALAVLYALYRIVRGVIERPRAAKAEAEAEWIPERGEALALLDDADRLAAEARFDEAVRLLLRRSVQQIASARPDWVHPASTAREIAGIEALPGGARRAFAVIAGRVERSLFALMPLGAEDWLAARSAYAQFALERLPAEGTAA